MSAITSFYSQYSARSFHRPETIVQLSYRNVLTILRQIPSLTPPAALDGAPSEWVDWFNSMDYAYEQFVALFRNPKTFRRLRLYTVSDLSDDDSAALIIWSAHSSVARNYPESFFPSPGDVGTHRPSSGSPDSAPSPEVVPTSIAPPPPPSGSSSFPAPSAPPASIKRSRGSIRGRSAGRGSHGRSKDKGKGRVAGRSFFPVTKVNCDSEVFALDLVAAGNPSHAIGSDRHDFQCDTCYVRGLYCEPSGSGKKCAFCRARGTPCSGAPTYPYTGPLTFSPTNYFPALMRREFPFHYLLHGLGRLRADHSLTPATSSAVSPYVSVPATTAVANTAASLTDTARQAQDALTALVAHPYLAYLTTSHPPPVPSVSVPVGLVDEPIDIESFD